MMPIDQGKPVLLVLPDLSAAFDKVSHKVIFFGLKDMFGLSGKVLEWIHSYLEKRSVFVIWFTTGFSSCSSRFHNEFPSAVIWGFKYHLFTDDSHLYISMDPENDLTFYYSLKM